MIWTRETSSVPDEWTPENPTRGQCAVTALLIRELLGGDLMRTTVKGESHYFNRLPNGTWLDLTLGQFDGDFYDDSPEVRDVAYVLSFPETAHRFGLLRRRALEALDE
jgi:hypothetical protein